MTQTEEESSKPEVIQLDQDFTLFDPRRTNVRKVLKAGGDYNPGAILSVDSEIMLSVPSIPDIPMVINAHIGGL